MASKSLLTLACLACITTAVQAQETFNELAAVDGKDFSKMVTRHLGQGPFDDGHGVVANLTGKLPRKVALVSIYAFDRGFKESKKRGDYIYIKEGWMTQEGTNYVASMFAERAVPKIVEQFAKYGMEVMTPAQFLTDDAKKAAYAAFEPDISGLSKSLLTKDDNFVAQGAAVGYLTKPVWAPFDYKTATTFGELARTLGVDAVVVMANEVTTDGDKVGYTKMGMHVFGPNPIEKIEGKRYAGAFGAGYNTGQLYEGEDLIPKKPVVFIVKKGKNEGANFDGYDAVAEKLAGNVAYWLDQRSKGNPK